MGRLEKIVECVMNVSEGRDRATLQAVAATVESAPETFLLDTSSDPDHHRTVFSFAGSPAGVREAALRAVQKAVELIHLTDHRGVHPRLGVVDVVPFIPIRRVSMDECVAIAREVGRRIAEELGIPVYLYGESASSPERREISAIRRGRGEGLVREIQSDPNKRPDFGPARLHPTAGATFVGARTVLVAYNVYLNTGDVDVARGIAARIRESGGGLPGLRALGFYIERRGVSQVSMNVTDFRRASLLEIFRRVEEQARQFGAEAASSEIVGLVPQEALRGISPADLKLENFTPSLILENRLSEVLGGK